MRQRVLDRLLAQVERRGDLLVGAALADQRRDLVLALGQRGVAPRGAAGGSGDARAGRRSSRPAASCSACAPARPGVRGDALEDFAGARIAGRGERAARHQPRLEHVQRGALGVALAERHAARRPSPARRVAAGEQHLRARRRRAQGARRELHRVGVRQRGLRAQPRRVELAGRDRRPHEPQQQPRRCVGSASSSSGPAAARIAAARARGSSSSAAKSHAAVRVSLLGSSCAVSARALARGRSASVASPRTSWTSARTQSAKCSSVRHALQARGLLGGVGLRQRGVELEQLEAAPSPAARAASRPAALGRCGARSPAPARSSPWPRRSAR